MECCTGPINVSYSSYGEDIILNHIFKNQSEGFYVDVGCFHPEWFSNTKRLFDGGWTGINIDPNAETIHLFNQSRPNDINLPLAVSDEDGFGEYYKFLEIDIVGGGSGNSLSQERKLKYEKEGLNATTTVVQIRTLRSILGEHARARKIDFMNIDAEGFDLQVLKSNDWNEWRPKIIAVEIWGDLIDYEAPNLNETYRFLREKNYMAFSSTVHTWFFRDASQYEAGSSMFAD